MAATTRTIDAVLRRHYGALITSEMRGGLEAWRDVLRGYQRQRAIESWLRSGVGVGRVSGWGSEAFAPGRPPRARVLPHQAG